jgi:hypothetical protein
MTDKLKKDAFDQYKALVRANGSEQEFTQWCGQHISPNKSKLDIIRIIFPEKASINSTETTKQRIAEVKKQLAQAILPGVNATAKKEVAVSAYEKFIAELLVVAQPGDSTAKIEEKLTSVTLTAEKKGGEEGLNQPRVFGSLLGKKPLPPPGRAGGTSAVENTVPPPKSRL